MPTKIVTRGAAKVKVTNKPGTAGKPGKHAQRDQFDLR
jgi:hypothetical protein